ncbi:sugar phosphate isomerase/epimerase family protein [Cohnella hashimotonis]|uniref:Sugar phosphate isomerase/epimerase family protein n=1 Tax=Cohnella hashimotonis TaxID=2826895 RepID=A0ABT6TGR7_9BACL|nr:sugar phosphate isomerase/epimerase family protein [Cohnella hashimotonis]
MKYAFVSFSCPEASLAEVLRMARDYNYDGFEARCGFGHGHGIEVSLTAEACADVKQAFADGGVVLQVLSVSCRYANPDTVAENIALTRDYIQLAQRLAVPLLRVFCGEITAGRSREASRLQIVAALRELAPLAEAAGVTLAVETHDDWSDPAEMRTVMEAVDHPSVGVVWDLMHTLRGGGTPMEEAYRLLSPWLKHVHFHDGLLELDRLVFLPLGEGEIDHRPAVKILIQNRYQGYLSGEWLDWEPPQLHLPRELQSMLRYEQEAVKL